MYIECPFCGYELDAEHEAIVKQWGPFVCPTCGREGCEECLPSGRGCECPECEAAEAKGEDDE